MKNYLYIPASRHLVMLVENESRAATLILVKEDEKETKNA